MVLSDLASATLDPSGAGDTTHKAPNQRLHPSAPRSGEPKELLNRRGESASPALIG
jgi:hypothetical protein